jgi:threonine dehydratase
MCGMKAVVYMPVTAPIGKLNATKGYGGHVIQHGLEFDEAAKKCREDMNEHPDWIYISAFDDKSVISGAGTCGLEIYEQLPDVETIVVPVGGGGLAAGISVALKALKPSVRIVCVQAAIRANFYRKFHTAKGREVQKEVLPFNGVPLGDGIAVGTPGSITFPLIRDLADEFVVVSEDEIAESIALLAERG